MQKLLTIMDFRKQFKSEEDCLKYLVENKWGAGFKCIKCDNDKWGKGRQWFYKRCKACGHDESATANTMFHKCKLGLLRAFEIGYRISEEKEGMSSSELRKEFGCQQRSASLIKAKFQNAGEVIAFAKRLEHRTKVERQRKGV